MLAVALTPIRLIGGSALSLGLAPLLFSQPMKSLLIYFNGWEGQWGCPTCALLG